MFFCNVEDVTGVRLRLTMSRAKSDPTLPVHGRRSPTMQPVDSYGGLIKRQEKPEPRRSDVTSLVQQEARHTLMPGAAESGRNQPLSGAEAKLPSPFVCPQTPPFVFSQTSRMTPVSFDRFGSKHIPVLSHEACHHRCKWPSRADLVL